MPIVETTEAQATLHRRSKKPSIACAPATARTCTQADTRHQLSLLKVHQNELEMQNSELKVARDAADTMLEKHASLYDFAPVGYFTLAADGAIRMANLAGSTMVGIDRARLLGRAFGLLIPADCRSELGAFLIRVFAGQAEQSMDSELLCKGHARRCVNIRARRSLSGDECSAVVMDITERKHTENQLNISEIRYRRLFEAARDGVLLLDPGTGKITDANPFMTELLGYPRERLIGKELYEIGLIKDEIASRNTFKKLKKGQEVRYEDLPLERQDGRHQAVEVVANLYQENGRDVIQCNVRDITDRKRAEGALAKEARQRLVLSDISARLLNQTTLQGVLDAVVCGVRELTGAAVAAAFRNHEKSELNTGAVSRAEGQSACPPEQLFMIGKGALCLEQLERKASIRLTDQELRAHPALRRLSENLGPLRGLLGARLVDARGELIGVVVVSDKQDGGSFTEEDELLISHLASITSLAMQHIEARATAERADHAKDNFLAVLSHELRTPLTPVVLGMSMLLDRTDLCPKVREILEMVRRNVDFEAMLIDDLLDVTRISRGKVELRKQRVQLGTVIQRAVDVCRPDLEAHNLHLELNLGAAGLCWIEADVSRLQQVFWNLLNNAIKFTPAGGCVGIRCLPEENCVVAEVYDNGIGMEEGSLSRVFNAFEQVESSITQQRGGLGLGLAICKAMVGMHGGVIEAQSGGRDKGATFRIRLPLAAPAGPLATDGSAGVSKTASLPQQSVRPLRILLVEDHGVTAQLTKMVLSAAGHRVEMASNVATALRLAGQKPFDLIVSDLGLPDGSGHELMRMLVERGHRFPGIALSGYGMDDDLRRSREAGFATHLTKPASPKAIIEAIALVMAKEP